MATVAGECRPDGVRLSNGKGAATVGTLRILFGATGLHSRCVAKNETRQVLLIDQTTLAEYECVFGQVLQLANIAGEFVFRERLNHARRDVRDLFPFRNVEMPHKVIDRKRNSSRRAQKWQLRIDRENTVWDALHDPLAWEAQAKCRRLRERTSFLLPLRHLSPSQPLTRLPWVEHRSDLQ